ncbi:restriction endonuclease subunit S [Pseudomonas aeruginosa]|uniref:restriction endonuclease subunit S n=1 Tax=Pseudomonas aeruginosa TaxID=287 RepID=UPI001067674B|nr:restriction endonuclease subunit S [Pseudomonas aeruginosa]TEN61531.1 restriction endonuclease subunit S [Pseudomonas aeruginosa]
MSGREKRPLVPRLRFPEFQETGAWEQRALSHYIESLDAGVSVNSGDRPARGGEIGILKTSCVTNGYFDSAENKVVQEPKEVARVKEPVRANTIVISRMNTIALVGANAFVKNNIPNLFLPDRLWAAKPTGAGNMRFLAYILGSEQGRSTLSELASGSSGTMKNIGKSEVLALQIAAPSLAEQQKISNCLSSLEDQILAETQKLNILKTHKKGLMQLLFPHEGETVPRLRFPEFRGAGEWAVKKLAEVCNVLQGYGFPEVLQGRGDGKYPFCKVSDISRAVAERGGLLVEAANYVGDDDLLKLRAKTIPKGATVFAKIGEALRLNRRAYVQEECLIDNNATGLKAIDGGSDDYFIYLMSQLIDLNKHCGGAVPSVNKSTLEEIEVIVPGFDEQKKIAESLSCLDNLISAQSQKIDALNTHKKGLMQQLFPVLDEVSV